MRSSCDRTDSYPYAVRHNPEAYYTLSSTLCSFADLSSFGIGSLRRFTFVTPNLCNDMHDCDASVGDRWLSAFLPSILASADYQAGRTVVFLTWDEDDGRAGNHVPTLVVSEWTRPGTQSSSAFTHYSLLRTTENLLGVPPLGKAASAPSMESAFHLP
jgi:phosphatidylinositol-3-phosphatase